MDGVAGMNEQDVHYILSCRPAVFAILPGCVPLCGECLGLADRLHPEAPAQGRQGRRRQLVQRLQARISQHLFRRAVGREVAHRGEAARSGLARRAHEEALARSRRELAQIELEARPLLERLAAGEPIDDGVRADLEVAEATIRDRIRSPLLQHPALTPELARLRRGGVHVLLLGEVPDDGGPHEPMAGPLAAAVVRELADAEPGGSVVIRRLPDGGAVSVVVRGASTTRQVQLSVDGTVLARR